MKSYPTVDKKISSEIYTYSFDKLDGSNIRAEWDKKSKKFARFGSRKRLLNEDTILGKAIQLIQEKYEKSLTEKFLELKYEAATVFFEFYGAKSFAGQHEIDDEHTVTLIDIDIYKKGIICPKDFIQNFQEVGIPKILHEGYLTDEIINQVKNGTLLGMTFEGIVCKGRNPKNERLPVMFKVKNHLWIQKLTLYCGDNEKLLNELL